MYFLPVIRYNPILTLFIYIYITLQNCILLISELVNIKASQLPKKKKVDSLNVPAIDFTG